MYYLQSRWKLENNALYYYGLQNKNNLFQNMVKLSSKQRSIIASLPKDLNEKEKKILNNLLSVQVVTQENRKVIPKTLLEATFCKTCCANDFIIPGLEFDSEGCCPMCQTAEDTRGLKSVVPLVEDIPHSKKSRFDIAVFYTGGKDSTYLLYYLSKIKKLRVLALTWEIPFMSDSAKASIAAAKKSFEQVEFITRAVSHSDLKRVYQKLYSLSGNTCACPSLAYVLFYPELVSNRIPYFVAGNEPVQMLGLYYNHMAPKIAYSFADNRFLALLVNIGRVLTLHPPLRRGQFQTLMTMKQLAYGDHIFKKISGYQNELVSNVVAAIHEVPELLLPFKRSIRRSSWSGNIPAFVHFDLDKICGGTYDWEKVKKILIRECGWVAPSEDKKELHTSCKIEKCKDYTQFLRFYHCQSKMIPFSALEISLASRNSSRSREETQYEMEHALGFSLRNPGMCCDAQLFWGCGIMTAVFCFSGSGHSLAVAEYLGETLGCSVRSIDQSAPNPIENAVVVFPVYCQNIPSPVKCFLKELKAKSIVLIATYGKISRGNVLWEAKKLVSGKVIAGACIPMGHTFLNGTYEFEKEALLPLFQRIQDPRETKIPRRGKNLFADFFPNWRSRISVKILRSDVCTRCNICGDNCPMRAMKNGIPNHKCIRCLRCVESCPQKALSFETSALLEKYLTQKRRAKDIELYL